MVTTLLRSCRRLAAFAFFASARLTPMLVSLAAVLVMLVPLGVLGQPAAPPTPVIPADPTDIGAWLQVLVHGITTGNWWLVAAVGVALTVLGLRTFVPETTKVGAWLRSKLGGIITNLVLSYGITLAAPLLAGVPFDANLALKSLAVALVAAGGWAIFKNVREAIAEMKVKKAGAEAVKDPGNVINQ